MLMARQALRAFELTSVLIAKLGDRASHTLMIAGLGDVGVLARRRKRDESVARDPRVVKLVVGYEFREN